MTPSMDEPAITDALQIGRLTLGSALRSRREQANLRIRNVAEALDVSIAHISDVERGRRSPSLDLLLAWATLLQTTVHDVLTGHYPWDLADPPPQPPAPPPDGRRRSPVP